MQYALLIYEAEADRATMTPEEAEQEMQDYMAFGEAISKEGLMRGGEALQPVGTATSVRVRDGEVLTTDGPFAETKEQLGGFYIVEAGDLDGAIDAARRIPGGRKGTIEIRPVVRFD